MKKILLLIFILFFANLSFAIKKLNPDTIRKLNQTIKGLNNQVVQNRNNIEDLRALEQVGNGTISNELASSQINLNTLGILFTVIGLILAVAIPFATIYITRIANRVENNNKEAREILATIKTLKDDVTIMQESVNATQQVIQSNLSALYQSLQDEEVKSIFNQLKKEPQDIQHLFSKLTTIGLTQNYFEDIKDIYFKTKIINAKCANFSMALLLQYYPFETLNDITLVDELKRYFVTDGLYTTEIQSYFKALCRFIKDKDINKYIELFINPILGIEKAEDSPDIKALEMLKTWNELLEADQKKVIINFINSQPLKIFKKNLPNWNTIITA